MNPLFGILLTVQIIICLSMGGLILVQRSEGGALGMGGGPSGFMSARGAGNLLTKATAVLALLFFLNSIGLTIVGNIQNHATSAVDKVDTSTLTLDKAAASAQASQGSASASKAPSLSDLPLATAPTGTPAAAQVPAGARPVASNLGLPSALPGTAPQKDINKAKAGIWASSASASSSASKP